jgi:hypothetical protein
MAYKVLSIGLNVWSVAQEVRIHVRIEQTKGSPDSPWKVAALALPTLRRLPTFDNLRLGRNQGLQFSDQDGNLFVSLDPAELLLRH